jgi:DNA-binding NarL/FixJ family response regulator
VLQTSGPSTWARRAIPEGAEAAAVQPIRVLLADDHAVMRLMLRNLIEHDGSCVVCAEAANGEEAVRFASEWHPDVAVLDISMPVMDGFEATRQIRTRAPATAVLIVTLHATLHSGDLARAAGARGLLRKSDAVERLTEAIHIVHETDRYLAAESFPSA